jgi:hypothetical protein
VAALWALCPPDSIAANTNLEVDLIDQICEITNLYPRDRIMWALNICNTEKAKRCVAKLNDIYDTFLSYTSLSKSELEAHFSNEDDYQERSIEASAYGNLMFEFLHEIAARRSDYHLIRYLAI